MMILYLQSTMKRVKYILYFSGQWGFQSLASMVPDGSLESRIIYSRRKLEVSDIKSLNPAASKLIAHS